MMAGGLGTNQGFAGTYRRPNWMATTIPFSRRSRWELRPMAMRARRGRARRSHTFASTWGGVSTTSMAILRALHAQALVLWASCHLDGLLSTTKREAIVRSLLAAQRSDGGWSLGDLGGKWHGSHPEG